jgi:aromatic ring-opening dioxygenase catalytic subunit (LigB family)
MNAFFSPASQQINMMNESFEDWLVETCSSLELDEAERRNRLVSWEKAPFARFCHPREEHLLPLHVCYGITGRQCTKYFRQIVLNKKSSMYLW